MRSGFSQISTFGRSLIQQLPLAQLEDLGEALLDFGSMQDLTGMVQRTVTLSLKPENLKRLSNNDLKLLLSNKSVTVPLGALNHASFLELLQLL